MSKNAEGGDRNNFKGFENGNDGGSSTDISMTGDYYQDTRDTVTNGGMNEESRFIYRTELLVREADMDVTLATELLEDPQKGIVDCMMMSSRLEQWEHRLENNTLKFDGYQGKTKMYTCG